MSQVPIDWESQQAEVERLYVDEDLTLAEVIDTMKSTRGFSASASSYQRKLKEWGVYKYIKWKGTNGLGPKLKKRKRDGKETDVYDKRGNLVPAQKMRRGIRRYAAATLSDSLHQGPDPPSPATPKGLIVCSPLAFSPVQWEGFVNGNGNGIHDKNGPWNRFLESLRSLAPMTVDRRPPYTDGRENPNSGDIADMNATAIGWDGIQWESPQTIMIQLHLISNNQLYRMGPGQKWTDLHDLMIAGLLERLGSTGLHLIKGLISLGDPITEAIRDRIFGCVIRLKRLDLLRIMLDIGVDLDANLQSPDWEKSTPLQYAAGISEEDVSVEMVCLFINHGAIIDKSASSRPNETPLCLAVSNKHPRVVDLLLNAGAFPGPDALKLAAQVSVDKENNSIAQKLLKAGADINGRLQINAPFCAEVTLLGWAAIRGDHKLADRLIELGADVNAIQSTECFRLLPSCSGPGHFSCPAPAYTTPLGLAAAVGSLDTVTVLLVDGQAETDSIDMKGYRCPLFIACAQRHYSTAMALLSDGARVPSADANAMAMECRPTTLLGSMGVVYGWSPNIELRLELKRKGARADNSLLAQSVVSQLLRVQTQGQLERFVEEGDATKTRQLLQVGISQTRLIERIGSEEVAAVLQASGLLSNIIGQKGPDILSAAILARHSSLARYLLDHDIPLANPDCPSLLPAPLDAAILRGDLDVIKSLVERKSPYTSRTLKLAIEAAQAEDMLRCLLPYVIPTTWRRIGVASQLTPVPTSSYAVQALAKAAELGRHGVFQLLFEAANWSAECLGIALANTILFGRHSLIQYLLDARASLQEGGGLVRRATGELVSAWDAALASRQVWIVEAFIKADVDVNKRSSQTKHTPLEVAARAGSVELTDVLLEAGANINAPAARESGATALQMAVVHNHVVLARRLLDAGADVNARGSILDGRTALEGAAEHGHLDMLHLLLSRGAEVHGDGSREQYVRAVKFAEQEGYIAAAKLLRDFGGWTELDILASEEVKL